MIHTPALPSIWIILGPILLIAAVAALVSFCGSTEQRPSDNRWSGIFYSDPDDPALFVPKRFGIGYTLNFGNRWSWAVLALFLVMVALPFILAGIGIRQTHQ